jgi:hypothetical protein
MDKFDKRINEIYNDLLVSEKLQKAGMKGARSAIDAAANLAADYETSKKEDGMVKAKLKDVIGGGVGARATKITKQYNDKVIKKAEEELGALKNQP